MLNRFALTLLCLLAIPAFSVPNHNANNRNLADHGTSNCNANLAVPNIRPTQIKGAYAVVTELRNIIYRSFTDLGLTRDRCQRDPGMPVGAVRCKVLFKPDHGATFDASPSITRLGKEIKHFNAVAHYTSTTKCRTRKTSKNKAVIESNGVECTIYAHPVHK